MLGYLIMNFEQSWGKLIS